LFDDEEKIIKLKLSCVKLCSQTQIRFFFPSQPSSSSGTNKCPQPTKKKGGKKMKEEKN
jgi:hypothetical protein